MAGCTWFLTSCKSFCIFKVISYFMINVVIVIFVHNSSKLMIFRKPVRIMIVETQDKLEVEFSSQLIFILKQIKYYVQLTSLPEFEVLN